MIVMSLGTLKERVVVCVRLTNSYLLLDRDPMRIYHDMRLVDIKAFIRAI